MPVFFPTFCTYMRELNLQRGGRKPSVCHSCQCCGFVSISKHPELGERRLRRRAAAHGEAVHPLQSPTSSSRCGAGAQPQSRPLLSRVAGGVKVPLTLCRQRPRAKSKRARGDLLASSAGGQVELSLTPYSRHLCLSLQINTITLNPQAEQRERVVFI